MIQVVFKNIDKSALAIEAVLERIQPIIDKFEDLKKSKIVVTIEMLNSPKQAGPDLFKLKLNIFNGRYNGISINKSQPNLYIALADVAEHMLEKLNRYGDKQRVKQRNQARLLNSKIEKEDDVSFS